MVYFSDNFPIFFRFLNSWWQWEGKEVDVLMSRKWRTNLLRPVQNWALELNVLISPGWVSPINMGINQLLLLQNSDVNVRCVSPIRVPTYRRARFHNVVVLRNNKTRNIYVMVNRNPKSTEVYYYVVWILWCVTYPWNV